MEQRRGVDEFYGRRELEVGLALVAEGAGREDHEDRPEALSPVADDVFADLADQRHFGIEAGPDHPVDCQHVFRYEIPD